MNPEIKTKWLEALRSGDYRQGNGQLKEIEEFGGVTQTRHCCLGVLCDLAVEAGVDIKVHSPEEWEGTIWFNDDYELTPPAVVSWAGLNDIYGSLPSPDECGYLYLEGTYESVADMNDRGISFDEIADVIEKEF